MSNLAVRQEDLDGYAAYAAKYNEPQTINFQRLQIINKEGRDGFGDWYVGRKFEGREVSIPGEKVAAIIVIDHYSQYSYYDKKTNKNLCHSPMFKSYPNGIRGSKFGYACGPECPHKEAKNCKMQKVVFCVAITVDGKKVPCIYYVKGMSFMPFVEYMKKATNQVINGNRVSLPSFAFVTELGTQEAVNGDTIYYSPIFKFSSLLPIEKLDELADLANQVADYVTTAPVTSEDNGDTAVPPSAPPVSEPKTTYSQREDMSTMDEAPWDNPKVDPVMMNGSEGKDLASAINAALGL
jgi:hypothetical protein